MNLDSALMNAASGLASASRRLAVTSQNVANAGTPGYVRERSALTSATAAGQGMGVRTGPAQRELDGQVQAAAWQQAGTVAGLEARSAALSAIDQVSGQVGSGGSLSDLLGGLRDAFSSLQSDPSAQVGQQQVVSAAGGLARGINRVAQAVLDQRQAAQDGIADGVKDANAALRQIGSLSDQVMALRAQGLSSADVESQRDAQVGRLAKLMDVQILPRESGDVLVATASGMVLPTRDRDGPFAMEPATVGAGSAYPGTLPALTLGGVDVTRSLRGGSMGAQLALRDQELPQAQAGLDEFAKQVATRFDGEGLRLFTNASGNPPTTGGTPVQQGYVGFALSITVNPLVAAQPSQVRDGTAANAGGYTPNPSGGPAGYATMVNRVLDGTFGAATPGPGTGLGPGGTLSLPYAQPGTLAGFAAAIGQSGAQRTADAQSRLETEQAVQTTLDAKFADRSGVNVDQEMSDMVQLQAAYQANAKVLTAAQAMMDRLLDAVR